LIAERNQKPLGCTQLLRKFCLWTA